MNAEWHKTHPLPEDAKLEERLEWHQAHAEQCHCREMPDSIRGELEYRGIALPPKIESN